MQLHNTVTLSLSANNELKGQSVDARITHYNLQTKIMVLPYTSFYTMYILLEY